MDGSGTFQHGKAIAPAIMYHNSALPVEGEKKKKKKPSTSAPRVLRCQQPIGIPTRPLHLKQAHSQP